MQDGQPTHFTASFLALYQQKKMLWEGRKRRGEEKGEEKGEEGGKARNEMP